VVIVYSLYLVVVSLGRKDGGTLKDKLPLVITSKINIVQEKKNPKQPKPLSWFVPKTLCDRLISTLFIK